MGHDDKVPYQVLRLSCGPSSALRNVNRMNTLLSTGQLNVNASQFLDMNQDNRGGHPLKLKIRRVKTKARLKFFSNRVTSTWNKLPQDVVLARNTNEFKNRLDEFGKISES